MAEVKPSMSRGKDPVDLVGEASCSGADGSSYPESAPSATAAKSPSFLTWMWIQILTACSGVRGARRGGLSRSRMLGLASGAQQQTQEDSESEVLSRIAASKSTWSEVPVCDIHRSVSVPLPDQLSVWEELKASAPRFFRDEWVDDLEMGRLIGEGGQAQIFEAKLGGHGTKVVLKVFKLDVGFSLSDLKRHWPRSMRKDGEDCIESRSMQERSSRYCGDLRTLIDLKDNIHLMEDNTHPWEFDLLSQTLFSLHDSVRIMSRIAREMLGLHAEGVLHRDLKAANVLIIIPRGATRVKSMTCDVADYECAMFVQGTRFWRAPEVLQELQKKEEDQNGEIWTEKVDAYSFGMTCYEILTGQIPFDGYTKSKWSDVIRGERPYLPNCIFPKLRELVEACWRVQPSGRPSFPVIFEKLNFLEKDIELGILVEPLLVHPLLVHKCQLCTLYAGSI